MKIVIFGATGSTGRQLVAQALAADHDVTAFVRDPAAVTAQHPRLQVVKGDVTQADSVAAAITGHEAVLSAIGPRAGTPPGTLISDATRHVLAGMRQHGTQRILLVSGLMVGDASHLGVLARVGIALFRRLNGALYRDKIIAEKLVRESGLAFTIVRPPQFDDRAGRGTYRLGEKLDARLTTMSSIDVAAALLHALVDEQVHGKALEVSY